MSGAEGLPFCYLLFKSASHKNHHPCQIVSNISFYTEFIAKFSKPIRVVFKNYQENLYQARKGLEETGLRIKIYTLFCESLNKKTSILLLPPYRFYYLISALSDWFYQILIIISVFEPSWKNRKMKGQAGALHAVVLL